LSSLASSERQTTNRRRINPKRQESRGETEEERDLGGIWNNLEERLAHYRTTVKLRSMPSKEPAKGGTWAVNGKRNKTLEDKEN